MSDGEVIGGNITDRALRKFITTPVPSLRVLSRVPFNSREKYSSTMIEYTDGVKKRINLIKGAPEVLLSKCSNYLKENGEKEKIPFNIEVINNLNQILNNSRRLELTSPRNN